MLLMIDNYDSFTYNVVQYLAELGADVVVHRNDEISLAEIEELEPRIHRHFTRPLHARPKPASRWTWCAGSADAFRSSESASATSASAPSSAATWSERAR